MQSNEFFISVYSMKNPRNQFHGLALLPPSIDAYCPHPPLLINFKLPIRYTWDKFLWTWTGDLRIPIERKFQVSMTRTWGYIPYPHLAPISG